MLYCLLCSVLHRTSTPQSLQLSRTLHEPHSKTTNSSWSPTSPYARGMLLPLDMFQPVHVKGTGYLKSFPSCPFPHIHFGQTYRKQDSIIVLPSFGVNMAVAQAPSIYHHYLASHSTPSSPSSSHSSRHDVNSLKYTFSPPLVECCACDDISRQTWGKTCHSEDYNDSRYPYERQASCMKSVYDGKHDNRYDHRNAYRHRREMQQSRERSRPPLLNGPNNHLREATSGPLLPPISFNPLAHGNDPIAVQEPVLNKGDTHKLPRKYPRSDARILAKACDGNRCAFPSCEQTLSATRDDVTLARALSTNDTGKSRTKPRALSLGGSLCSKLPNVARSSTMPAAGQLQKPLHRKTGSRELRHIAGSLPIKRDCDPWVDQIIQATQCADSYPSTDTRSLRCPGRPRLWLDATRNEAGIEKAVRVTTFVIPLAMTEICSSK